MEPKDRIEQAVKTKVDAQRERSDGGSKAPPDAGELASESRVERLIDVWPPAPKKIAEEMMRTYGPPNEATRSMLIWHGNGPWKRTIVTSDETAHDFPTPHTDYISQTINFDVPFEKLEDLARYDGSLIIHRTAGQVTASCDNEASNFLALNLMYDIMTGNKTPDEARHELAEQKAAYLLNREAPYTEGILFAQMPESETGDRDEPIMKSAALHQVVEKVKDVVTPGD